MSSSSQTWSNGARRPEKKLSGAIVVLTRGLAGLATSQSWRLFAATARVRPSGLNATLLTVPAEVVGTVPSSPGTDGRLRSQSWTWVPVATAFFVVLGLTQIYGAVSGLTHVGTAMLLKRFPGAKAYATAGTIEVMRFHGNPEFRAATWDKGFPGQIPDSPVVSTPASDNVFKLEGNDVRLVEVGHSDTDKTSVVHVPSIGLVVGGDVVYNGYHQYLAESANGGLKAWMTALDTVASLKPTRVVASHKNKDLADDPKVIQETRRYLEDAERVVASSTNAREFYDAMVKLYPDRKNRSALWFWGAKTLFKS